MKIDLTKLNWIDVNLSWNFYDWGSEGLWMSKESLKSIQDRMFQLFSTRFCYWLTELREKDFSDEELAKYHSREKEINDWVELQPEYVEWSENRYRIMSDNFYYKFVLEGFDGFVETGDGEILLIGSCLGELYPTPETIIRRCAAIEFDRKLELSTPEIKMLQEIDREGFVKLNINIHVEDVNVVNSLVTKGLVMILGPGGPQQEWIQVFRKKENNA